MENIIIIRVTDPDNQIFQKIVDVLKDFHVQTTIIDTSERTYPGLKINLETGAVVCNGKRVFLNRSELAILDHMTRHPGRIFSKEQLYLAIYGEQPYNSNAITTSICRLRRKIEPDAKNPTYIKTVFGMGYKFEPPNNRGDSIS